VRPILDELDRLIAEGDRLAREWQAASQNADLEREFSRCHAKWVADIKFLLRYAECDEPLNSLADSLAMKNIHMFNFYKVVGTLESVRDSFKEGFTGKMRFLLHADMFDSLVGQAEALLMEGHRIPAAVLGRIVVERWVRDEAEKAGIVDFDQARASTLNDALRKQGAFTKGKSAQVQSFLTIGNSAAHGKDQEFDEHDVQRILDFVKANCV